MLTFDLSSSFPKLNTVFPFFALTPLCVFWLVALFCPVLSPDFFIYNL